MKKVLILILVMVFASCNEKNKNNAHQENHKFTSNDTLFSEYFYLMPKSEFNDYRLKNSTYKLITNKNKTIPFKIQFEFNQSKLDSLKLVYEEIGHYDIDEVYNEVFELYKNKYKEFDAKSSSVKHLYKTKYKMTHIYWGYQTPNSFRVLELEDNDYVNNQFGGDFHCRCYYGPNMHQRIGDFQNKKGYHVHALNKNTNEKWSFEVDTKVINNNFAVYDLDKRTFYSGKKKIIIELKKLKKPSNYLRGMDFLNDLATKVKNHNNSVNDAKMIPQDQISISYSFIKNNEESSKSNLIIDKKKVERTLKDI